MQKITIDQQHAPSLLPDGHSWQLAWNDEFDGTELDRAKWFPRLHIMQQRFRTFCEDAFFLDGESNLHLTTYEKDGHFYSTQLQTGENFLDRPGNPYSSALSWPIAQFSEPKFLHKYGYYEVRCKLQKQPGWWSAFWMQSPIIGANMDTATTGVELDIMENFTRDGLVSHNLHWGGYGKDHKHVGSGNIPTLGSLDDFHYYGMDWSPNGYVFYIDGKESWRSDIPVSHCEQFIILSTECQGYRRGDKPAPELTKDAEKDAFVVDFVRVFDRS